MRTGVGVAMLDKAESRLRRALAVVIALMLLSGLGKVGAEEISEGPSVTWTMVDVTEGMQQGDAHVIRAGGAIVLIDAGTYELARARLVPHLRQNDIEHVDMAFVSHAHTDHYGGLRALLEAGIRIERVEISLPEDEVCRREIPWGCNPDDIRQLLAMLRKAEVPVVEPIASVRWHLGDAASLVLVNGLDGASFDAGNADVNDTSLVLRLDVAGTSVLFTGDLNDTAGRYLATRDLGLQEKVLLKVPHHGAESLAPDEFFTAVDPDFAFVPGPMELWRSDRSSRVRMWLEAHDVPTFVSGEVGNVTVHLDGDVRVETQRPHARG